MWYSRRILAVVLGLAMLGSAHGKSLDEETPVLVQSLAKQLVAKQRVKVATLDFTDIQGRPNELGRFIAEQLAVDMVMAEGITVIDRANINSVMAEHQLTAEGLVKPENAKKLGQFAGVDALLIGNLAAMDNVFTLTVKAISTETAEVVAAGRMKFDVTQDSMKQFGTVLSGGTAASMAGGNASDGNPSTEESRAVAKRMLGNVEVVLRTVTPSSLQSEDGESTPTITLSFDLYNRDLRSTVAIAANGSMVYTTGREKNEIVLRGYRGALSDSAGQRWMLSRENLVGISSVLCCECVQHNNSGVRVAQNNPTAVADYVKHGKKCEMGDTDQPGVDALGRYWTGSFSTIPPGKSIRVTPTFVRGVTRDRREDSKRMPQSFQFDMELVIGSIMDGEVPEKAKDLRLENLTFDKIVMPTADAKE